MFSSFRRSSAQFLSRTENQIAVASLVSATTFWLQWELHRANTNTTTIGSSSSSSSIIIPQNQHMTFCDAAAGEGATNAGHKKHSEFTNTQRMDGLEGSRSSSMGIGGMTGGGSGNGLDGSAGSTGGTDDNTTMFYGQCLARQLHRPKIPYPAWDYDWDHRETELTSQEALSGQSQFAKSKSLGKTRHIILIRHGQYDERYKEDRRRKLTPLGRHQAELTGQRLAMLARGGLQGGPHLSHTKKDLHHGLHSSGAGNVGVGGGSGSGLGGPLYIKAIHVSDMERAKETARIIHSHLPHVKLSDPDPMLNEALPAPMIPIRPDIRAVREIDANHSRVEAAFQKYFHRADANDDHTGDHNNNSSNNSNSISNSSMTHNTDVESPDQDHSNAPPSPPVNPKHEFEIIVAHGNIIRFFFCRALQLPPEAWLRISTFNCSMTYIMIYPNGYVSCRMLGDVGHLGYDNTTFSGSHGYNW